MERFRAAAVAEINRLEKLEVKADQRLLAKYRELVAASSLLSRNRLDAAVATALQENVALAMEAWDAAADDRLRIVVRLLSVHRLLAKIDRRLSDRSSIDATPIS